jgi:hypothetical protein
MTRERPREEATELANEPRPGRRAPVTPKPKKRVQRKVEVTRQNVARKERKWVGSKLDMMDHNLISFVPHVCLVSLNEKGEVGTGHSDRGTERELRELT